MKAAAVAETRFGSGFSCSQSVFSALAERWDIDPGVSLRVAAGFGGGMGRSAKTCGCVTGAIMAIGMAQRSVSPEENRAEKEKTYELVREFMRRFEARHGSTVCAELLGCDISTGDGLAKARQEGLFQSRCPELVRSAVEVFEEMLPHHHREA
jgi:C_GCAxxG_C_C family probable redox protein